MLSSCSNKKLLDKNEESESKLSECKALGAGLESCSPTSNEGEGSETVRHSVF